MKLEVSVVGPCYHDDSLGFDSTSREITVDVDVRDQERSFGERFEYSLGQRTSKFSSGWSEPYAYVEATVYGRSAGLQELETKAKMLRKLFAYVKKLPVQPHTLAEWVATIAALHKMAAGTLMAYKDHRTRPEIMDEGATVVRMCNEVAKREQALVPEPATSIQDLLPWRE